ncbi:MAG: uroporphyrinogen-III synthase [Phocaeicola sp.]|nr:uroporphyrinogen-III synthase [Phocaeicola sp.]MDD7447785.1 uroporphyrinogen-III synthase [Prevotellaceae bacterium]MDY3914596.1 uroporphyrinogen-III synthase [Phocaeicola sp.]MDY5939491.1 uroporphyrinogen-III synthase [Phocaeicola sp.]
MEIKKILVSQPRPATERSPYYDIAEKFGVEIDFHPFIKVESLSSKEFRQQKVSILNHTAIVFNSRHAIDHFFTLCKDLRITVPETMKYFCTSETISLYIQKYVQYRKRKVFFGDTGKFADLLPIMVKHSAEKYFVPQSEAHTDEITNLLKKHKLNFSEAVMYRTVANDISQVDCLGYDMIIFFTPIGVQALLQKYPDYKQGEVAIGCYGPATAKAVKDLGLRLDFEAGATASTSITAALSDFLKAQKKKK